MVNAATIRGAKKSAVLQVVSESRETEENEKEEGSLNIFIVPMKAGKSSQESRLVGKEDVWGRNCNLVTLNEPVS